MGTFHLHNEIYNVSRGLVSVTYPPEQWIIRGRLSWQETIHVSMLNVKKMLWQEKVMIDVTWWFISPFGSTASSYDGGGPLEIPCKISHENLFCCDPEPSVYEIPPPKYIDWIIETLKSPIALKLKKKNQVIWGSSDYPVDPKPLISGQSLKEGLVLIPGEQALFPGCRGRREEGSPACFVVFLPSITIQSPFIQSFFLVWRMESWTWLAAESEPVGVAVPEVAPYSTSEEKKFRLEEEGG